MGRTKGARNKNQPEGNRSASGRLRNREPSRIDPCDGVVRRKAFLGVVANDTNTCDALGRAFSAGLLGPHEQGTRLLNAGRTIAWQYWRIFHPQFPTVDSLARFQPQEPRQATSEEDRAQREKIIEAALNDGLKLVRDCGHDVRRAFEQLCIDPQPDSGPRWLDEILWARRQNKTPSERDSNMLRLAIKGLEALV